MGWVNLIFVLFMTHLALIGVLLTYRWAYKWYGGTNLIGMYRLVWRVTGLSVSIMLSHSITTRLGSEYISVLVAVAGESWVWGYALLSVFLFLLGSLLGLNRLIDKVLMSQNKLAV